MKFITKMTSRGDTIVEVLIAVALMGVILTGAYAISNRSSTGIRQGQERAEALKIAESQVEKLKVASASTSSDIFTRTDTFCAYIEASGASIKTVAVADLTPPQPCKIVNGITYDVAVDRTHAGNSHLFNVTVSWPSATGNGDDRVVMKYRLDT